VPLPTVRGAPPTTVAAAPSRRLRGPAAVLVVLASVAAVALVTAGVDADALGRAVRGLWADPLATAAALLAFAAAFALRSWAWCRVLPGLSFGQSWAGIHVALAGNHVLPLRLGEPLRVVSVVRRTVVRTGPATATTMTLRAADLLALLAVAVVTAGLVIGQGTVAWLDSAPLRVAAVLLVLVLAAGLAWTWRLRATGGAARLPGPLVIAATAVAWVAESVLTLVVARATGLDVDLGQAALIGTAAVLAQVAAVTPGGFGPYEAGATAAYVVLGFDAGTGLAAALAAHAVKTLYAVGVGGVALFLPGPSIVGRLRLPAVPERAPEAPSARPDAPVVLFMPAHNEEAIVGAVVARAPATACGHPVRLLVVDDGSTDATVAAARAAGATVIGHAVNQGLGAAVRTGLREALLLDPAAVAFCDADGEYAPEELERLVSPILSGRADYVIGSRFDGEILRMQPHRRLGNVILTKALSVVARRRLSDGQSGYRAFSAGAARDAEVVHDFNYAQVITLDLLGKGYRYAEVPITYAFRTTGTSFVRLGRYLRAVIPAVHRELNNGPYDGWSGDRSGEQSLPEVAGLVDDAGQGEEEAAALGEDVLLQRLALETGLHGEEARLEAALVGHERQSLVELAGAVEAAGVGEAAAQHEVGR